MKRELFLTLLINNDQCIRFTVSSSTLHVVPYSSTTVYTVYCLWKYIHVQYSTVRIVIGYVLCTPVYCNAIGNDFFAYGMSVTVCPSNHDDLDCIVNQLSILRTYWLYRVFTYLHGLSISTKILHFCMQHWIMHESARCVMLILVSTYVYAIRHSFFQDLWKH